MRDNLRVILAYAVPTVTALLGLLWYFQRKGKGDDNKSIPKKTISPSSQFSKFEQTFEGNDCSLISEKLIQGDHHQDSDVDKKDRDIVLLVPESKVEISLKEDNISPSVHKEYCNERGDASSSGLLQDEIIATAISCFGDATTSKTEKMPDAGESTLPKSEIDNVSDEVTGISNSLSLEESDKEPCILEFVQEKLCAEGEISSLVQTSIEIATIDCTVSENESSEKTFKALNDSYSNLQSRELEGEVNMKDSACLNASQVSLETVPILDSEKSDLNVDSSSDGSEAVAYQSVCNIPVILSPNADSVLTIQPLSLLSRLSLKSSGTSASIENDKDIISLSDIQSGSFSLSDINFSKQNKCDNAVSCSEEKLAPAEREESVCEKVDTTNVLGIWDPVSSASQRNCTSLLQAETDDLDKLANSKPFVESTLSSDSCESIHQFPIAVGETLHTVDLLEKVGDSIVSLDLQFSSERVDTQESNFLLQHDTSVKEETHFTHEIILSDRNNGNKVGECTDMSLSSFTEDINDGTSLTHSTKDEASSRMQAKEFCSVRGQAHSDEAVSGFVNGTNLGSGSPNCDTNSEASNDSGHGGSVAEIVAPFSTVDSVRYEFNFPSDLCGRLIGRGGKNIHHIKEQSGANITLTSNPYTPDFQICCVQGAQGDVDKALSMIRAKFPLNRYHHLDMKPLHVPPPVLLPEIMQLNLPEGVSVEVVITAIVNAGHIFVQQPTHPTFPSLERLGQFMNSCYSSDKGTPPLPKPVEVGVICAAESEGAWYRAQIMQVDDKTEECDIKYVDYGGYVRVSTSMLKQIRSDFMTLPFQAVECYMANITPLQDEQYFSDEASAVLDELTTGKLLQGQVITRGDDSIPYVHIYQMSGYSVLLINREMVNREVVRWIEIF